jgi:hypothetical protein
LTDSDDLGRKMMRQVAGTFMEYEKGRLVDLCARIEAAVGRRNAQPSIDVSLPLAWLRIDDPTNGMMDGINFFVVPRIHNKQDSIEAARTFSAWRG